MKVVVGKREPKNSRAMHKRHIRSLATTGFKNLGIKATHREEEEVGGLDQAEALEVEHLRYKRAYHHQ